MRRWPNKPLVLTPKSEAPFARRTAAALGTMSSEASEILKVYLGASETGGYLPFGHEDRMSIAYKQETEAKLSQIQRYLDVDHAPAEWSHTDLAHEQQAFESQLAQRFPELDRVAINSLACRWSYSWR